jgi:Tol biopolymer transport system component
MRDFQRVFVVVSALAALVAGAFAPAAGAAFPGQNGKIAFTTYYLDGNENIYSIAPDGTGLRRLTADTGFDDDAAWSPNGRRIAFASNRAHPANACEALSPNCDYDIYVMNAYGTNVKRLTVSPGSDREPYWSPDGKQIVFASTRDDPSPTASRYNANLYVMNADGSGQTRITNDPGVDSQPAWSPGGTAIAFFRVECEFNCGVSHLFRVGPDGGGLLQLTAAEASDRKPDWSPDGAKIVFQREQFSNGFWTMNPDGSAQTRIPGLHLDPAWSPDGLRIAFGYPGIGHMNPDGGSPTTINSSGGEKPDWQPLVGPRRADYRTAPDFCRAERAFLGAQEFNAVYRSFGGCVSAT